jgi:hypothetical protein
MAFCEEHSKVMKCLGALEQGQNDIKDILQRMELKFNNMQIFQTDSKVSAAVEKTKSNLLYWVIAIASSGVILGLINLAMREFSKK